MKFTWTRAFELLWSSDLLVTPHVLSSSPLRICLSQGFPGSGVKGPVTVTLDEQTSACLQYFHIFSIFFFLEDKQLLIVETLKNRFTVQRLPSVPSPRTPFIALGYVLLSFLVHPRIDVDLFSKQNGEPCSSAMECL